MELHVIQNMCLALVTVVFPNRHVHRIHAPIFDTRLRTYIHACLHTHTYAYIHKSTLPQDPTKDEEKLAKVVRALAIRITSSIKTRNARIRPMLIDCIFISFWNRHRDFSPPTSHTFIGHDLGSMVSQ